MAEAFGTRIFLPTMTFTRTSGRADPFSEDSCVLRRIKCAKQTEILWLEGPHVWEYWKRLQALRYFQRKKWL